MDHNSKNTKIHDTVSRFRDDYEYRTMVSAIASIFVSLFFAAYNFAVFLKTGYEWNIGIAVYYALLCVVRAAVEIAGVRGKKRDDDHAGEKTAVAAGIFTCMISVALVLPIAMMTMNRREVHYDTITAITVATYTTYKIVVAVRAFLKTRHAYSATISTLKNISLVDALTSVLSLQYTLIVTFGDMSEMFTMCAFTSFAIWVGIVGLSIRLVIVSVKTLREAASDREAA